MQCARARACEGCGDMIRDKGLRGRKDDRTFLSKYVNSTEPTCGQIKHESEDDDDGPLRDVAQHERAALG